MTVQETLKGIVEQIRDTATVKTIYGEPVKTEGKTIVPVARVRYGFGGGGGTQEQGPTPDEGGGPKQNVGGGGGGGIDVTPIGFIEVTQDETRFVSFEERPRIIKAAFILSLLGLFLLRRRFGRSR